MKKTCYRQFETEKNSQGQYICKEYKQVEVTTNNDNSWAEESSETFNQFTNPMFSDSYLSHFSGNPNQHIIQMREQFEQMRKKLLEQMNSIREQGKSRNFL